MCVRTFSKQTTEQRDINWEVFHFKPVLCDISQSSSDADVSLNEPSWNISGRAEFCNLQNTHGKIKHGYHSRASGASAGGCHNYIITLTDGMFSPLTAI